MSQLETRGRVVQQMPSLRMDNTSASAINSEGKHATKEITFIVSADNSADDSEVNSTKPSAQVIWTYSTEEKLANDTPQTKPAVVTTRSVSVENTKTRKKSFSQRDNISQPPTFSQIKNVKYSPIEYGVKYQLGNTGQDKTDSCYSTKITKSSVKSGSKPSYTYKVQEGNGLVILESFTKHPAKINIKTASQTYQNTDGQAESQTTFHKEHQSPTQEPDGRHFRKQTTTNENGNTYKNTQLYLETESVENIISNKNKQQQKLPKDDQFSIQPIHITKEEGTPKLMKENDDKWITQTATQEELRSEQPHKPSKLSTERIQHYQKLDSLPNFTLRISTPKKLQISDVKPTITSSEQEPGIVKTKQRQLQESRVRPSVNMQRTENNHFLYPKDTENVQQVYLSSPAKLVIPDFNQGRSSLEVQELQPPPKQDKFNAEQWLTQTIKQDELRSELPPPTNKLPAEKMQFLQHQETQVERPHVTAPGKLVMPQFQQDSYSIKVQELPPPPKPDKINAEQWIPQTIKQEDLRSELPSPTKKLSLDKMQFLHSQETQNVEKLHVSRPGKLVIPDFNQESSTLEVQKVSSPQKLEPRVTEEWITRTTKQQEVQSEPPPTASKLSAEKIQFLQNQETQKVERVHLSSPGKLVIPDFNQDSSTVEVQELPLPPPPKQDKINAEIWITQTIKQDELRSELPPPTNKLPAEKMQFLQHQETQVERPHVTAPGKLVIPEFRQDSYCIKVQEEARSPKPDIINSEQWITQTIKQEELRTDFPPARKKLLAEKMLVFKNDEFQGTDEREKPLPGRLVLPEFNKNASGSFEVDFSGRPGKAERQVSLEWIGGKTLNEEDGWKVVSVSNKPEEMEFVRVAESQGALSPRKLVIPDNGSHSISVDVQKVSLLPGEEKAHLDQPKKLESGKMQFVHNKDSEPGTILSGHTPRKLIIPDFSHRSSTIEVHGRSPPPRVNKLKTEQWVTQTAKQKEIRSEVPPSANKLTSERMKFIFVQDTQSSRVSPEYVPGKLAILDFNQEPSYTEIHQSSPPLRVDGRSGEQWITQPTEPEENRDEASSTKKGSALKHQFVNTQDIRTVTSSRDTTPGKVVIPDFGQSTSAIQVNQTLPPPKCQKRSGGEWLTHSMTREELRTVPLPVRNKLSGDKLQIFQKQHTQEDERVGDSSSLSRVIIPDFCPQSFHLDAEEVRWDSTLKKHNSLTWITEDNPDDGLTSGVPRLPNKPSEDAQSVRTSDSSSTEKYVIPDYGAHSFSIDVGEDFTHHATQRQDAEHWVTQKPRTRLPLAQDKASTEKLQFVHPEDVETERMCHRSKPGKLVIPDFEHRSSFTQAREDSLPRKMEKRRADEWTTHSLTREEIRSLPLPSRNKLSADKLQLFSQNQETQRRHKSEDGSLPGKFVIPDYGSHTFSVKVRQPESSKHNWKAQTISNVEFTSELPSPTDRQPIDVAQFRQTQEGQPVTIVDVALPGKLVIPAGFH